MDMLESDFDKEIKKLNHYCPLKTADSSLK